MFNCLNMIVCNTSIGEPDVKPSYYYYYYDWGYSWIWIDVAGLHLSMRPQHIILDDNKFIFKLNIETLCLGMKYTFIL